MRPLFSFVPCIVIYNSIHHHCEFLLLCTLLFFALFGCRRRLCALELGDHITNLGNVRSKRRHDLLAGAVNLVLFHLVDNGQREDANPRVADKAEHLVTRKDAAREIKHHDEHGRVGPYAYSGANHKSINTYTAKKTSPRCTFDL